MIFLAYNKIKVTKKKDTIGTPTPALKYKTSKNSNSSVRTDASGFYEIATALYKNVSRTRQFECCNKKEAVL